MNHVSQFDPLFSHAYLCRFAVLTHAYYRFFWEKCLAVGFLSQTIYTDHFGDAAGRERVRRDLVAATASDAKVETAAAAVVVARANAVEERKKGGGGAREAARIEGQAAGRSDGRQRGGARRAPRPAGLARRPLPAAPAAVVTAFGVGGARCLSGAGGRCRSCSTLRARCTTATSR